MATIENRNAALQEIFSSTVIKSEFVDFFLGDLIGWGCSRMVFENRIDLSTVIKIDISNTNDNCREFEVWNEVQGNKKLEKWFAPVVRMSKCGRILVQKRCKPLKDFKQLPKKIPSFLADVKYDNFGIYKGKPVMFDYASNFMCKQSKVKLVPLMSKYHG